MVHGAYTLNEGASAPFFNGVLMETFSIAALIAALVATATVSTTIDPDLFIKAEEESKQVIEQYDQQKRAEYDQVCRLMKGCKKEGNRYVL